jgi:outer membrane biogenesis lipoprotein LolB
MIRGVFVLVMASLLAILLTSCATTPVVAPPAELKTHDANVVFLDRFVLKGRLSVRVGEKLDTARIEWTRESTPNATSSAETRESMRFFTPFGSQVAEVIAEKGKATLRRDKEIFEATGMAALTQQLVGVAINTDSLARWVQGIDLDKAVPVTLSQDSTSSDSQPRKWQITAENFRPITGAPGSRVAARINAIEGDTVLRLVIDEIRPLGVAQ